LGNKGLIIYYTCFTLRFYFPLFDCVTRYLVH